jgi:hypothetical protein
MDCIAKWVYEYTRGVAAYNMPTFSKPYRRYRNQHATWYRFKDGSVFVQYTDFDKRAWRKLSKPNGKLVRLKVGH